MYEYDGQKKKEIRYHRQVISLKKRSDPLVEVVAKGFSNAFIKKILQCDY